jgi:hypothetical protein
MYEDLRNLSEGENYFEEEDPFDELEEKMPESLLMGMKAGQRLLIAILLLATVLVMGAMVLLVTTKVWIF